MQRNLFTYIWRHSRPEQLVILSLVVLAQVFYFMSLTVPKSIVNNGIQGNAFKQHTTIPFLVWELDLSAILPGKVLRLFDGFQVDQLTYLVTMSFVFLAAVVINGQFKKSINTQKGRMGERMLRRLRYELFDRILRFPPAHFRKVKQAELATMIKDEVEPLGGFIGDAFVAADVPRRPGADGDDLHHDAELAARRSSSIVAAGGADGDHPAAAQAGAGARAASARSRRASSPAASPRPSTASAEIHVHGAARTTSAPTSPRGWAASSRSASTSTSKKFVVKF